MAEQAADKSEAITSLTVEVGELSGVLPEYLHRYFPEASKGTRCEGARLDVNYIAAEVTCKDCNNPYHPSKDNNYRCPVCNGKDGSIIHGRELNLLSVTVDQY